MDRVLILNLLDLSTSSTALLGQVTDQVIGWIIDWITALIPVSGALGYVSRLTYR